MKLKHLPEKLASFVNCCHVLPSTLISADGYLMTRWVTLPRHTLERQHPAVQWQILPIGLSDFTNVGCQVCSSFCKHTHISTSLQYWLTSFSVFVLNAVQIIMGFGTSGLKMGYKFLIPGSAIIWRCIYQVPACEKEYLR